VASRIRGRTDSHDLSHPVCSIVHSDHCVAVTHGADWISVPHDYNRHDELVGHVGVVRRLDCIDWRSCRRTCSVNDCAIRELRTLPALVAIHGVIATRDTRNLNVRPASNVIEKLLHVSKARARHRIAPIHECVNGNARHVFFYSEIDQGKEMGIDRMHSARTDEAHQVKGAA